MRPAADLLLCQTEQLNVSSSPASYVHIYKYIHLSLSDWLCHGFFNNQSKLQGFWHFGKLVRRRRMENFFFTVSFNLCVGVS